VNHYGKPDVAMFDFTSMFQVSFPEIIIRWPMEPDTYFRFDDKVPSGTDVSR
jgi:hypothetical protein